MPTAPPGLPPPPERASAWVASPDAALPAGDEDVFLSLFHAVRARAQKKLEALPHD